MIIDNYSKILGDLSDLSKQPKTPLGYIILLEVRGGVDKGIDNLTIIKRKGHRPDTMPICNELIKLGWGSVPIFYSDNTEMDVLDFLNQNEVKGIIVRINPGQVEGVSNEKWRNLVSKIDKSGVRVMSTPEVMEQMGSKQALSKIGHLNCGLDDTEIYYSVDEWRLHFINSLKTKRVIKQNRGSSGEGIWVVELKNKLEKITGNSLLILTEAVDNHVEEKTIDEFLIFCEKYLDGLDGLIVNQRFCPRIIEGEVRVNMIFDEVVALVHKKPILGGISATLSSGAEYTQYSPKHPKFSKLIKQWNTDKPNIMDALGLKNKPLPLIWTADFIFGDDDDSFIVGEFNCSCVGIATQLKIMAPKVAEAAVRCVLECRECNI
jgi:hypothetical protein